MKLNKLVMASLAVAALGTTSLSAAIDPDIAGKNGLALKQYAQQLKARAAAPHHAIISGTDTDELLQDIQAATGDCAVYIAAEIARERARAIVAIQALGNAGDNLLGAVIAGGGQPADVTVGGFEAAFLAAFDAATGHGGAIAIHSAHPANGRLATLGAKVEEIDGLVAAAIDPWIAALHAGGLGQANVLDAGRRAAITGVLTAANGGLAVADTLQGLRDYLVNAVIRHA